MPKFIEDFLEWRKSNQQKAFEKLWGIDQTEPLSFWQGWFYHVIFYDLWTMRVVLLWAVVLFSAWYFDV
ncbi:MAG: hypothetical protein OXC80_12340 [Gammaproteobacteria bacterium]|nr:hypothetical protein [Gammaproteobacteria bacterium]